MNIWKDTVLTDKGAALQAKLMQGQTLKITGAKTGAGSVPAVNLRQQTDVTEERGDITLQPARTEGDQTIIPVLLENKDLKEGYELWQIGFYAEDPDEGEILYCIAQATKGKDIPAVSESPGFSVTWDFYFQTSNTAPFEVMVNSKGLVRIEEYQIQSEEIDNVKKSTQKLDDSIIVLNTNLEKTNINLNATVNDLKTANTNIQSIKNQLADTGWINAPLASGVYNLSGSAQPLKYRRKNGIVYVSGVVKVTGKSGDSQKVITTLPAGFRIMSGSYYYFTNAATGGTMSRYLVLSSGNITLEWVRKLQDGSVLSGDITWVGIDISYPV